MNHVVEPVAAPPAAPVPAGRTSGRQRTVTARALEGAEQAQAAGVTGAVEISATANTARKAAKEMQEVINDEALAARCQLIVDVCEPIVQLLRLADSGRPGGIGKMYDRWFNIHQ